MTFFACKGCLIKRVSEASEAFSLVMKTHNYLRSTCVSSPQIDAHAYQSWAQRAPPPLVYAHEKSHVYHPVSTIPCSGPVKAWKVTVVWTDATMPPCNDISIRSTPEIMLSSKNYKKAKMKGGLSWMTKYRE